LRGRIVDTKMPKATYNAAFNAKAAMCNVFNFYPHTVKLHTGRLCRN
jgi:hypothetical protein